MKGRPVDPTRKRRGTGNRPKPGETRVVAAPALPDDLGDLVDALAADLPDAIGEMFRLVLAELGPRGLKAVDLEAIRLMCLAAHRAREAAAQIAHVGLLVEGKHGPVLNPLLRLEREATSTYLRLAEQYGLTLAARLRLGLMQLSGQSLLGSLNEDLNG